jgi:hypothetical protein
MADVPVKFILTVLRPDQRQYRQQEVELVCQQELEVVVPLTAEYIANSEEVIQAKLSSGNVLAANPRLTVAGLKYVIDQFDNVFLKVEEKEATKTGDDDWLEEDTKSAVEKKSAPKVEEEDWENDTKKPDEVPWDEKEEEWDV